LYKYFFINLLLINVCFNLDYLSPNYFPEKKNNSSSDIAIQTEDFDYLIGIMVDFPIEREEFEDSSPLNGYWDVGETYNDYNNNGKIDYNDYNNNNKYDQIIIDGKLYYEDYDNPKTSGLGKFILNDSLLNYNLENFISRCDNLIIDNFPHNSNYFLNQLLAVKNYYSSISNQLINFEVGVIDSVYTASKSMEYYSSSDQKLGELFSESVDLAKESIENYLAINNIEINDVLFVVFHAGLGQDFSVPFLDPTSNDLKSAYIDNDMLDVFNLSTINDVGINRGILLPETQNFIFYDVVEDIFPELKNDIGYCGIQVGLTGTFAFLLGYGLNLEPMFLTDGTTGIGKFGLMDYGSNNGRGVIPSVPNPWTRIKIYEKYLASDNLVSKIATSGTYTLAPRHINDRIYRIDISDSEYYLIENRSNNVVEEFDLDFLQFLYGNSCGDGIDPNNIDSNSANAINECMEDSNSTNRYDYFDLLNILEDFTLDGSNSVITNINNYDYGLPGSGLLIWHIDEGRILNNLVDYVNCGSVNCELEYRGVKLEEADGAVDIGYKSSHPLFTQHVNGWEYDFWYPGNQYYFNYGNPNISNNDTLFFNNTTMPNTQSNDGSISLVSIQVVEQNEGNISFKVSFENTYESVLLSDSSIQIIGSGNIDNSGNIFYIEGNTVYQHNNSGRIELNEDGSDKKILVYNNNYHFIDLVENNLVYWDSGLDEIAVDPDPFIAGYYESSKNIGFLRNSGFSVLETSLGDLDLDGFDELVFTLLDSSLAVQNNNETYINGFPLEGSFYGTPIIANILNIEDNKPEIICREGNHITVLSSGGDRLLELSSFDTNEDIRIIPNWKANKAALADGNRLILLDYDEEHSYWLNKYSNSYDYPLVLNHDSSLLDSQNKIQSAYNYPNPITKGYTTFRFYVDNENQIKINIYDLNGLKVKTLETSQITNNEYNEIIWNNIKGLSAGLYYAEIIFDNKDSELIKLAIIQ